MVSEDLKQSVLEAARERGATRGIYADGWTDGAFAIRFSPTHSISDVLLRFAVPERLAGTLLTVSFNDDVAHAASVRAGDQELRVRAARPLSGDFELRVVASSTFCPADLGENTDLRRLALHLRAVFIDAPPAQQQMPRATWVPPGHFYSPLVDTAELQKRRARIFDRTRTPAGIDLNEAGQLDFLARFARHYPSLPFTARKLDGLRYYFENPAFSYADALVLSCLLLEAKPKRLIEFGSGFSSCVTLDINERFLGNSVDVTFIEPYPQLLLELVSASPVRPPFRLLEQAAQDTDLALVRGLQRNDVLFIDSTHVAKAGSDVNFHVFEVLPALQPGVFVHFHDMFYPFEYPESWFFEENRSWNELYVIRAFLMNNADFEIVFFNDFMQRTHRDAVARVMPDFAKNSGGSLWLRRK